MFLYVPPPAPPFFLTSQKHLTSAPASPQRLIDKIPPVCNPDTERSATPKLQSRQQIWYRLRCCTLLVCLTCFQVIRWLTTTLELSTVSFGIARMTSLLTLSAVAVSLTQSNLGKSVKTNCRRLVNIFQPQSFSVPLVNYKASTL